MIVRTVFLFVLSISAVFAQNAEHLDKVIAVVNDDVITETELNQEAAKLKNQMMAQKAELPPVKLLKKQVLNHMILSKLQLQLAKNNNITVDDLDLDEAIKKIAANNKMTLSDLRRVVSQQGVDWKTYRESIRKEMLISNVQQKAVKTDLDISQRQVDEYLKTVKKTQASQGKYHVKNVVISLADEPGPEDIKAAKQKALSLRKKAMSGKSLAEVAATQSEGLSTNDLGARHLAELPDIYVKQLKNMKPGDVSQPIRAGNGIHLIKLVSISGGDKGNHVVTMTHARHILLKPGASTTTVEAEKQVNNLYQQLKSGKNFAELAKQYSVDLTSATNGGDLGWIKPGETVTEFEKAMDKLSVNEISEPVKSTFGWHIIQVLERKKVDDSDAYERQKIRMYLQQRKFSEAVQSWQQQMKADAFVDILEKDYA